jgi:hypothetical protein
LTDAVPGAMLGGSSLSLEVSVLTGGTIMPSKTRIRRPVAIALMLLGAVMMYSAPESRGGLWVLVLGVAIELVGIAIKRKE